MVAAGSASGDLYVWLYEIKSDGDNVTEIFADTTQYGSVVGADWMKAKAFGNEYELLTCHKDGHVLLWKIGSNRTVRDKMYVVEIQSCEG